MRPETQGTGKEGKAAGEGAVPEPRAEGVGAGVAPDVAHYRRQEPLLILGGGRGHRRIGGVSDWRPADKTSRSNGDLGLSAPRRASSRFQISNFSSLRSSLGNLVMEGIEVDCNVLCKFLIYLGFIHSLIPPNHFNTKVPKLGLSGEEVGALLKTRERC